MFTGEATLLFLPSFSVGFNSHRKEFLLYKAVLSVETSFKKANRNLCKLMYHYFWKRSGEGDGTFMNAGLFIRIYSVLFNHNH